MLSYNRTCSAVKEVLTKLHGKNSCEVSWHGSYGSVRDKTGCFQPVLGEMQ